LVSPGLYTFVQALDPVSGIWLSLATNDGNGPQYVNSDGANWRLANLTGCPVGAIVTNVGSAYTSAPVVTASAGGSTWTAIVGGAINTTVTIGTAGSGYTLPPLVLIAAPAPGGVQATAYAVLTAGVVSSIVVVDQGAGYATAPIITIVPQPNDPSTTISAAAATTALITTGTITAVLNTYQGTPQTSLITLTFSGGGGSSAAATVIGCFTTTAAATTGTAGAGYVASTVYKGTALGGYNASTPGAVVNPSIGPKLFIPREANFGIVTSSGAGAVANATFPVIDGGLYQNASAASALMGPPTSAPSTVVTFTTAYGGVPDISFITPLL
jgi:hypothetical protein